MKHQRGIWLLNEIPLTYYYLLDFEINLKFFFNTKLWDYLFVLRNIHKFKSVISLQKERRSISSILWFASVAFHFIVVGHKTHPMQRIGLAFPIKSFWMFPISLLKKLPPSLRNCNNYNGFLEFCRRLWIESSLGVLYVKLHFFVEDIKSGFRASLFFFFTIQQIECRITTGELTELSAGV